MPAERRSLFRQACNQDSGNQEHQARRRDHIPLRSQLCRSLHRAHRMQVPRVRAEESEATWREQGETAPQKDERASTTSRVTVSLRHSILRSTGVGACFYLTELITVKKLSLRL